MIQAHPLLRHGLFIDESVLPYTTSFTFKVVNLLFWI